MKAAIITIAGISSRFNQGISPEEHILKAIYHEGSERDTLLYHMLERLHDADRIVLVVGYKKEDLQEYIDNVLLSDMRKKTTVVVNDHYEDWSSGYSLFLGINEALRYSPDSILFAEGDLDVDNESFNLVNNSGKSVITCNHDVIYSKKAVIGYRDVEGKYKYAFSTSHGSVSVDEPFTMLFNSGQIWKFTDMRLLKEANEDFDKGKETGTNLVIVADYFSKEDPENIGLIDFKRWVNCNTRDDYRKILAGWETEK
jgi:choline kinase